MNFTKDFFKPGQGISQDVKLITFATALRWLGWGVVESLIPVFLFSFAHSYATSGLLNSIYDIAFMLTLPFVGMLADKISSRTILIIGAILYPFIGVGYFEAGLIGSGFLLVMARLLNGVAYAFDQVGRETFFRVRSPQGLISTIFGYFDSVTILFWIVAVLFSLVLIKFLSIYQLFLGIVPMSIIATGLLFYLPYETNRMGLRNGIHTVFTRNIFSRILGGIRRWSSGFSLLVMISYFLGTMSIVGSFVVPIEAYSSGSNLPQIIILSAVFAAPSLVSVYLGIIADKNSKRTLIIGFLLIAASLAGLVFAKGFIFYLIFVFALSIAINLASLAVTSFATRITAKNYYGQMSGFLTGSESMGELTGPIVIGIIVDKLGGANSFYILSGVTLLVTIAIFVRIRNDKSFGVSPL